MRSGSDLDQVDSVKMGSGGVLLLLALVSASRAAPLCEQLLTPVQQLDISVDFADVGRWHLQAVSGEFYGDSCVSAAVMELFQSMSATFNFILTKTPNNNSFSAQRNLFGFCSNYTTPVNITLPFVKRTNNVTVSLSLLPLSRCSDCVVMSYIDGSVETLHLYSRRQSVTLLELKNLQILASCLKLPRPWLMNTDYQTLETARTFPRLIQTKERKRLLEEYSN